MERFAQLLLGLFALALLVQLVQRGPGGAAAWTKAKFLGTASSSSSPAVDDATAAENFADVGGGDFAPTSPRGAIVPVMPNGKALPG